MGSMTTREDVINHFLAFADGESNHMIRLEKRIEEQEREIRSLLATQDLMTEALRTRLLDSKVMLKRTFQIIREAGGAVDTRVLTPAHRLILDTFDHIAKTEHPLRFLSEVPSSTNLYRDWRKSL